MSEVWFELGGDDTTCREEVLGIIKEEGWIEGVMVRYGDPPDLVERISRVHSLLPWVIEVVDDCSLWVEAPVNKLPHLHVVLGILRGPIGGYVNPRIEEVLFKTAMNLGYLDGKPPRDDTYNGIHSFVNTNVPALEFYNAIQKVAGGVRENGVFMGRPYPNSVQYFLTPEELLELYEREARCHWCSKKVELSISGRNRPLDNVATIVKSNCLSGKGQCYPKTELLTFLDIGKRDSHGERLIALGYLVVRLSLLVNGGNN